MSLLLMTFLALTCQQLSALPAFLIDERTEGTENNAKFRHVEKGGKRRNGKAARKLVPWCGSGVLKQAADSEGVAGIFWTGVPVLLWCLRFMFQLTLELRSS